MKKKFPEVVTVEPRIGERAMLVKDHHGDSAVLVGRWELHNKHKGQTASTCKANSLISETFVNSSSTNKRNSFIPP